MATNANTVFGMVQSRIGLQLIFWNPTNDAERAIKVGDFLPDSEDPSVPKLKGVHWRIVKIFNEEEVAMIRSIVSLVGEHMTETLFQIPHGLYDKSDL